MGRGRGGGGNWWKKGYVSPKKASSDTSGSKANEATDARAKAKAEAEAKAAKAQKATKQSPFKAVRERSQTQAGFNSVVKEALAKKNGRVTIASLRRLTGLPRDKFDNFIKGATEKGLGYPQSGEGVNPQLAARKASPSQRQNAIAAARRKNQRLFKEAVGNRGIYFVSES